jgi:dihydrofolate reductase
MAKVFADVGISLDGYIAGPNARPGNPLGDGGPRVHQWMYPTAAFRRMLSLDSGGQTGPDDEVVREVIERTGAHVMGRNMFDEGEVAWPARAPFGKPVFVATHRPRDPWVREGGTTFHFVESATRALELAKNAAGKKDVRVSGGARIIQQLLRAGLIDELSLHVAPVLLGDGTRLFDRNDSNLEQIAALASENVTHVRYRVIK